MIDFPYQKYIREDDYIEVAYKKLCDSSLKKSRIYKNFIYTPSTEILRKKIKIKNFGEKPFYLSFADDPYTGKYSTNSLSDMFNEHIRMKTHINNKLSPYEFYSQNKEFILKSVKECKNLKKYYFNLREKIYELHPYETTPFRPDLYACIIEMVSGLTGNIKMKVLDPSSGWGDRLIAFISSKYASEYYSTDPNKDLYPGYENIIKTFNNCNKKIINLPIPFEESKFEPNYFDLVCTSPPFFDFEIYSDDSSQSVNKYPKEKIWFDNFLNVLMFKSESYLKSGGYLILHISQHKENHYLEWLLKKKYDNLEFCGMFGCEGESSKKSPLFVWKKN
jgi:hypothetical protein